MSTLKQWFETPSPVLTYDYNKPELSHVLGDKHPPDYTPQGQVPPPQRLYDLASYRTPFRWLWKRPRNVLQA